MMAAHAHIGFGHAFITLLELLLVLIPLKLVAAHFVGRSTLADAVFAVL
jgi:hypothetical protein